MSDPTTKKPAETKLFPTMITLRPSAGSSLKEITLISGNGQARDITLVATNKYQQSFGKPDVDQFSFPVQRAESTVLLNSKKIPRPPNAFMIFANEWRKELAQQHSSESNKSISIRLGQLWKKMSKGSKEIYYQRSRQVGQDHKQKYPGYVYNPKEARLRKALREQTRVSRHNGGTSVRWPKQALTMNHPRHPLISPVLLSQHLDNRPMHREQVSRDNSMIQSYSNYLNVTYNNPPNDYSVDPGTWYPYMQLNGLNMDRTTDNKLPVDWSTPYSSEQGNFIGASPESSPYSVQNNRQEVNILMLNGERSHPDGNLSCDNSCFSEDHKPVVDQIVYQPKENNGTKDSERRVKELLASAKVIPEDSLVMNAEEEDSSSTLSGFHKEFGATDTGHSHPDGIFEAAVSEENESKRFCEKYDFPSPSFSPGSSAWSSLFPYRNSSESEPDLFGFQGQEETCNYMLSASQFNEPNHLYSFEENFYDPNQQAFVDHSVLKSENLSGSNEFEPQDLSAVTNVSKPPVIISQNDNCCVVMESSVMDDNMKEYFSL